MGVRFVPDVHRNTAVDGRNECRTVPLGFFFEPYGYGLR
jgi:hypothetical protein